MQSRGASNERAEQDAAASQFLKRQPAIELPKKTYSLQPDMAMGWLPKMKIIGPIPLNFDNDLTDSITHNLLGDPSTPYRVVYLEAQMHEELSGQYIYKYQHLYKNNYLHLQPFFKKFYQEYNAKTKQPFKGMNPNLDRAENEVIFNGNFEGGNLDAVVRVQKGEYDVFMRIDSNTRGHNQWYDFKVRNRGQLQKIRINIVNFKRRKTLYQRGMKPFVRVGNGEWSQAGEDIQFEEKVLRYQFLKDDYSLYDLTSKQLSFEHKFNNAYEQVQFAYSVPYTYSRLLRLIESISPTTPTHPILKHKPLCQSLSGLQIPLVTITDPSIPDKTKKCIFIIARQHPGESNGSLVMQGFLKWVCSDTPEARSLREIAVVKIVPMLNPDGVVLGNFRTSVCGRDLNRLFRRKNCLMFPEIQELKEEVIRTKKEFRDRFLLFMDFHGHSVRKNVFTYGPGFILGENNYYKSRIFPKIISNQTNMFRYYSCSFRISENKQSTARAFLCRYVPYCYTVESSNSSYYCSDTKMNIDFTENDWITVGREIGLSSLFYLEMIVGEERQAKLRLERLKEKKQAKEHKSKKDLQSDNETPKKNGKPIETSKSVGSKQIIKESFQHLQENKSGVSTSTPIPHYPPLPGKSKTPSLQKYCESDMVELIKQDQIEQENAQNQNQSDKFDSQGSDSQSQNEDLSEANLRKFNKQASKIMMEFEHAFFRRNNSDLVVPHSLNQTAKKRKSTKQKRKSSNKPKQIQVMACLKSKVFPLDPPTIKIGKLEKFKSFQILQPLEKVPSLKELHIKKRQKIERIPLAIKQYKPISFGTLKGRDTIQDRLQKMQALQSKRPDDLEKIDEQGDPNLSSQVSVIVRQYDKCKSDLKTRQRQFHGLSNKMMIFNRVMPKKNLRDDYIEIARGMLQDYLTQGSVDMGVERDRNSHRIRVRNISRSKDKDKET